MYHNIYYTYIYYPRCIYHGESYQLDLHLVCVCIGNANTGDRIRIVGKKNLKLHYKSL